MITRNEKMRVMHEQGMTQEAIAAVFRVGRNTVRYAIDDEYRIYQRKQASERNKRVRRERRAERVEELLAVGTAQLVENRGVGNTGCAAVDPDSLGTQSRDLGHAVEDDRLFGQSVAATLRERVGVAFAPLDAFLDVRGVHQAGGHRRVLPICRRREGRDVRDRRPGGHLRHDGFGEPPGAEKVDLHHPQRIADSRGHPRDVEQRVDPVTDRLASPVDRHRIRQVQLDERTEILGGRQVLSYDLLVRIAEGLGVPRGHLGLAYDQDTAELVKKSGGEL